MNASTKKQSLPFVTQMKDHLDGMSYPEIGYETEQQAVQYAQQRSAERRCDITVRDHRGQIIGVYTHGELVPQV
jgi:hypothetical protein